MGWMVVGGYAQVMPKNMPENVKRFLENYVNDSTARWGPKEALRSGDFAKESIQIEDLKVGRVLEIYQLKHIFLNDIPDTIPFSEIIEPTGYWFVLITAHDKPLYQLLLKNTEGELKFIGMNFLTPGFPVVYMWNQLLKTYPESTGINPVFFSRYGFAGGSRERILYFEQKGPRKIYYATLKLKNDPLDILLPNSIETLNDSRKLIEYWKKQGLNEVGRRGVNRAKTEGEK
jgi:hypothetical protein